MSKNFVNLHIHSFASIGDSVSSPAEIAEVLSEQGSTVTAITDHGNMINIAPLFNALKKKNIRLIPGFEAYVAEHGKSRIIDKTKKKKKSEETYNEDSDNNRGYNHLVLLAMNHTGYVNLCKLCTEGYKSIYYKPRIDFELLKQYNEGIIASSACIAGAIPQAILDGDYDRAKEIAQDYKNVFGKDRFYLELQDHGIPEESIVNSSLIKLAEELDLNLIATNDAHFARQEDALKHDVFVTSHYKQLIDDPKRTWVGAYGSGEHYIKSYDEMMKIPTFQNHPEALENTNKIAEMCTFTMDELTFKPGQIDRMHLPPALYDKTKYNSEDEWFEDAVWTGLKNRYGTITEQIKQRAIEEMDTIKKMGLVSYHWLVQDYITWAKDNHIATGPSRGSAGGSIVCYALRITEIDPLEFDLSFSRYLNVERISMADIDTDFGDTSILYDYACQRFGEDNVSHTLNLSFLKARSSLQEVARILGYTPKESDEITKLIPAGNPNITLEESLESSVEIKQKYNDDPKFKQLWDYSSLIEGIPNHTGVHASAIIIADKPITNYAPLLKAEKSDVMVVQVVGNDLEGNYGLIKMDFLGLNNLNMIEETRRQVLNTIGTDIDLTKIDKYSPKYIRMYKNLYNNTVGVFQFESAGMSNTLKKALFDLDKIDKLKTDEELRNLSKEFYGRGSAVIALYRPGPMDNIPEYISNMQHPDKIKYIEDSKGIMKKVLSDTYGVLVYQEQLMSIISQVAGKTDGFGDRARRAIAKKHLDELAAMKDEFIEGAISEGNSREMAEQIWEYLDARSGYSFNKSHSIGYFQTSYFTALLSYLYPVHFMCSILSCTDGDDLKKYISICKNKLNINIVHPDINQSQASFTTIIIDDKKPLMLSDGRSNKDNFEIVFGLSGIKGLSAKTITPILEEREKNGPFKSYRDFLDRCESFVNIANLKNMIYAGCFDCFDKNRQQLSVNAEKLLNNIKEDKKRKKTLAEREETERKKAEEEGREPNEKKWAPRWKSELDWTEEKTPMFSDDKKAFMEKEVTGTFFEYNPIKLYKYHSEKLSGKYYTLEDLSSESCKVKKAVVLGVFSTVKKKVSKNTGKPFIELTLSDDTFEVAAVAYDNVLEQYESLLLNESKVYGVIVVLKRDENGDIQRCMIDQVYEAEDPAMAKKIMANWDKRVVKSYQDLSSKDKFSPDKPPFPLGLHLNLHAQSIDSLNANLGYIINNFKKGDTNVYVYYYNMDEQLDNYGNPQNIHVVTSNNLKLLVDDQTVLKMQSIYNNPETPNINNVFWQKRLEPKSDLDSNNESLLSSSTEGKY